MVQDMVEQDLMYGLAALAEEALDCEESLRGEVMVLPPEIMEELATLGLELLKGWERYKNAGRAALLHFHCSEKTETQVVSLELLCQGDMMGSWKLMANCHVCQCWVHALSRRGVSRADLVLAGWLGQLRW